MSPSPINHNNRGSVYLVTLITVAAIASMVMIGVTLRSATNSKSNLIDEMSQSNTDILNATQLTLQTVYADPTWNKTAQSGVALPKQTINGVTYDTKVKDADTNSKPTDTTTNYRLILSAKQDSVKHTAHLTINHEGMDYAAYVESLSAEFYWPLTEPEKASKAVDYIRDHNGNYLDANAGAGTNDQGAPVPVFNNSSDQVSVSWNSVFQQGRGSLSCWIKFTGPTRDYRFHPFIGMNYESGGHPTLNIAIFNGAVWAYTCEDGTYSVGDIAFTGFDAVTPDNWHHITIVWGDSTDGLMVFVDGSLEGQNKSNTDGVDTEIAVFGGEQPLFLGSGYDFGDGGTPRKGFLGSVAHVVYFDNNLTPTEVEDLAATIPDELFFSIVEGSWATVYQD